MLSLPTEFLTLPIAHRAYHDRAAGRPENSGEAVMAAIEASYGIEIDLQLSADGVAMVFHDYHLSRLTADEGPLADRTAAELQQILLTGGASGIPTFAEVLDLVGGRVPLLVEVKDQDGLMGSDVGALERAAAEAVRGYEGPLAFMSFNPHSVAELARLAPEVPRGLTTCSFAAENWPTLPEKVRTHLAAIQDFDRTGASFISHHWADLGRDRVSQLRAQDVPVLCWTIRSPEEEAIARRIARNVTFEGYAAAAPA